MYENGYPDVVLSCSSLTSAGVITFGNGFFIFLSLLKSYMPSLLGLTSLCLSTLAGDSTAALSSFAARFSPTEPVAPLTSLSSLSPFAFLSFDTSFAD